MTSINVVTASQSTQSVTLFVPGTAGTPSADVMTVQGSTSTSAIPVPVALSTTVTNAVALSSSATNTVALSSTANTVQGSSAGTPLPISGKAVAINGSFVRTSSTTTYTSGDAVTSSTSAPTPITFSNCARIVQGSGYITGATMVDTASQTLQGEFELWLFDTTFTADNDNAVFTPTDAELATCIGVIDFASTSAKVGDATSGAGGNVLYRASLPNPIPFACPSTMSLYGGLVIRNAYLPVASSTFVFRLMIDQN